MHKTKEGNQWRFGMQAHIGVDVKSGLTHTFTTTVANGQDLNQACVYALIRNFLELYSLQAALLAERYSLQFITIFDCKTLRILKFC